MANPISVMMLRFMLGGDAHALYGEDGVGGTAVAFFADTSFFAPEITLDGVALGHLVVSKALGKTQPAAVAELANQRGNLPLDVSRRPLGRIIEENLVLDLQPPQLMVEEI